VGGASLAIIKLGWVDSQKAFDSYLALNGLAEGARVLVYPSVALLLLGGVAGAIITCSGLLAIGPMDPRQCGKTPLLRILEVVFCAVLPTSLWFGLLLFGAYVFGALGAVVGFSTFRIRGYVVACALIAILGTYLSVGLKRGLHFRMSVRYGFTIAVWGIGTGIMLGIAMMEISASK
jgi:hypothetical protein